ncbi:MAG: 2OG-Fe dioxygenase family protein [Vibrio sp.]
MPIINEVITSHKESESKHLCIQKNIFRYIKSFPEFSLLRETFGDLIDDNYLQGKAIFRKRRYSTCTVDKDQLYWQDTSKTFFQPKEMNNYAGGIERRFESLGNLAKSFSSGKIIPFIMEYLELNKAEVGIHQIRITANNEYIGLPAPEGPHQDGFDFVCTVCINKTNTAGGNSIVLNHNDIVLNKQLEPGDLLLIDDKHYYHYASPIVPLLPGEAWRDMFIFTINQKVTA